MGNVLGVMNGALNKVTGRNYDFSSALGQPVNQINSAIAGAKQKVPIPGMVYSLGSDRNGVLVQATYSQCLPTQTSGKFPDGTTVCLTAPDWKKVTNTQSSCVIPQSSTQGLSGVTVLALRSVVRIPLMPGSGAEAA